METKKILVDRLNVTHNLEGQHILSLAEFHAMVTTLDKLKQLLTDKGYELQEESEMIQNFFPDATLYRLIYENKQIGQIGVRNIE